MAFGANGTAGGCESYRAARRLIEDNPLLVSPRHPRSLRSSALGPL